jgi:hypothetical protein
MSGWESVAAAKDGDVAGWAEDGPAPALAFQGWPIPSGRGIHARHYPPHAADRGRQLLDPPEQHQPPHPEDAERPPEPLGDHVRCPVPLGQGAPRTGSCHPQRLRGLPRTRMRTRDRFLPPWQWPAAHWAQSQQRLDIRRTLILFLSRSF